MDPITTAAGSGIEKLFDYGAVVIVLVLVILGGAWLFRYMLNRCDTRFDASMSAWREDNQETRKVIEKNTEAFHGVNLTLTRLESKVDTHGRG